MDETGAPVAPQGEQPPAKLSKLSVALARITSHVDAITGMDPEVVELTAKYPTNHVFAVATKDGYKLADDTRAAARKLRLRVKEMRDDGTTLLNGLKTELWGIADPAIATLQAIEDNAKAQRDKQDLAETNRKQRHRDAIAAIALLSEGAGTMSSVDLMTRRASALAIVVDDSYEEFEEEAKKQHADVLAVLADAYTAAQAREAEAERKRKVEERATRAREAIAKFKALPDGCRGTGVENINGVADRFARDATDEATLADLYGDLAEFVTMAKDKAIADLRKLAIEEAEPEPTGPFYWWHGESGSHGQVETIAELEELLEGDPLTAEIDKAKFDELEAAARAAIAKHDTAAQDIESPAESPVASAPAADPDPFSAPIVQPPAPRTVTRAAIPTFRASPAPAAAPAPGPSPALAAAETAADLYAVARRVRAAYVILSDNEAATLPATLRAALEELKRAIHVTPAN